MMPVRLTRKYSETINGIDLSGRRVGDRVALRSSEARLLLAEGWAEPLPASQRRGFTGVLEVEVEVPASTLKKR